MILLDRHPCQIDWGCESQIDGQPLRWQALLAAVTPWRRRLAAVAPIGARIALRSQPSADAAALIQAAAMNGHCLALIDHRQAQHEQQQQLERCSCQLLIHDQTTPLQHPHGRAIDSHWPDTKELPKPLCADDDALLIPTSGSNAQSKIVVLSLANLLHASQSACLHLQLTSEDCWACPLPLDHIGGFMCIWRAAMSAGRVLLCPPDALPDALPKCSGASLVPTMLARLLEAQRPCPAGLKRLLIGGAAADPSLVKAAIDAGYRPLLSYGCSESASMAAAQNGETIGENHCGQTLPGIELRVDEHDHILLRGPQVFRGYLDGAARDTGSWHDTGDLGATDAQGRLHIIGRADRRIVSGGENVDPLAIEAVLCQHPAIAAALVGAVPDQEWGSLVVAALKGHGPRPDDHSLEAWLRQQCSAAARPKRWLWLDELPQGRLGKPDHQALSALFSTMG